MLSDAVLEDFQCVIAVLTSGCKGCDHQPGVVIFELKHHDFSPVFQCVFRGV